MKRLLSLLPVFVIISLPGFSQVKAGEAVILFHGLILDAATEEPLPHSQIFINRIFTSISDAEGKFAFYVSRKDTVVFRSVGYKQAIMNISDTLRGKEFLAGVFMHADTVTIGEVVIFPRMSSIRSDLLGPPSQASRQMENARYNIAISSYQGKVNTGKLGDPTMNYESLRQQQKDNAYSKGQIPADKIVGLSPLLLIPAAYLLIHGLPEKPSAVRPVVTDQEVELIREKYLETIRKK
jgi:hypothetical protein